jgi:hypothetical protein
VNIFISYRRAPSGSAGPLPKSLYKALIHSSRLFSDEIVFDVSHVTNESTFATDLVDKGLNNCDVLIVAIDENWFLRIDKLIGSSRSIQCTDWVEFELRYSLEHQMLVLILGTDADLHRFNNLHLAPNLWGLHSQDQFSIGGNTVTLVEGANILTGLRARKSKKTRRLESALRAGGEHNHPRLRTVGSFNQGGVISRFIAWFSAIVVALSLLQCILN